ncbi:MAG: sigma-70 family RNA polymerase sigma factor [Chitinophagales bacterium]|nr:sigma-70 family RNA polymerase sigma factor [Chitinophagales bacterium]
MQATLTALTDREILNLLAEPRSFERGFRLMMQQYQERIYWHVRRMVGNHEDTNDVVQNCFIKVYRSVHRFEEKSKLYTWIYRIATNEAITFINRRQKRSVIDIDDEDTGLANQLIANQELSAGIIDEKLRKAMMSLPEKQCLVFTLRYFEEMGYKEMSEQLGTSVGALKASYHHAVKKIEEALRG